MSFSRRHFRPGQCLVALTVTLAGMAATPGLQADIQLLTEDAYLEDMPRILTGSRLRQATGDSPVSVTVIDREMIEHSGAREIQELLRLVPGMVVSYTFGHWASVTPGFGAEGYSRRLEVLIDGRSVYTPSFGGVPWAALPYSVSDIERIEVTRGPNSHAFGTNALLGTINIITRDPADRSGGEFEVLAGDDFVHRLQVRQFGSSERTDWSLSAAQWGDHGFDSRVTEFDGKSHRFINGQLRVLTGPSSHVMLRGGYNRGRHEWGRSHPAFEPPREQYWQMHFGQMNWEYQTQSGNLLEFRFDHSVERIEEDYYTRPLPALGFTQVYIDEYRKSLRTEAELQHTIEAGGRSRFLWGLGWREDEVRSPPAYFPDGPASNTFLRTFAQMEWQATERMTFNAGAMLENDQITGTDLSPRLGLNFHATPQHTVRLAAARATRTPVLIEEMGDWSIDMPVDRRQIVFASGGLQRETVDSIELGHVFESADGRMTVDTRIHYDEIRDMIMYLAAPFPEDPYDGFAIDFDNTDEATVRGLETEVEFRPTVHNRFRLAYSLKDISSTDTLTEISESGPRHNISLFGLHRLSGQTEISGQYFYYSAYNIMNLNDGVERTRRLDLRLSHRLDPQPDSTRVALVIQSVQGTYDDSRPRNRFDRRIFGEIRIPF
ncbi:TonB-dependent receptor plug domain-containing protein [Natronospira bacteriovora]|uniref:TonB-dependent receptor n=1 Tax=Natronospira bacteriovora TaxID=3069753 RepID=A0ABU0W2U2_9GAMM|nr:TonB-dependent receptor [Natronospira sp. AB-CW4]MDQ2068279.1 TonB-dependent receptor [Natronospira sp. AB-CW4]